MKYSAIAYLNVRVPMRDGVELSTQIYLPSGGGSFPVLCSRTPYDALSKGGELEWPDRGFACVRQDVRGKFRSGGEWYPWMNERNDGEDTLNWIAAQSWCNGNIAMYGGSYVAATQSAVAITGHPALKCFTPCLIGGEFYHANYRGGAFRLGWQTRWTLAPKLISDQDQIRGHLPLLEMDVYSGGKEIPFWRDVLSHPLKDSFWEASSVGTHLSSVQAPAFIRTGWFDHFVGDIFDLFNGLRKHGGNDEVRKFSRILIGPWAHSINVCALDDEDFGEVGKVADLYEQEIEFIKYFVASESAYDTAVAPIRLFVMGANLWRDEYEWPLARTTWTEMFLSSGGQANTSGGDGCLGGAASGLEDHFDYDPEKPVPLLGGAWDFSNVGPRDQTQIELREDVLVYTSEELIEDREVTGPVTVKLYASSSARDTDFTAKLVDVRSNGKPMSVTDGIIRARYRDKGKPEELLRPGAVYEFTIECNPTSYLFKKGHKIRLEISSSNFPAFSRNLNTGNDTATDVEMVVAHQAVFHSAEYPSRIILPVIQN